MKKTTTTVNQPDKTESNKSELLPLHAFNQKMYRDHAHHNYIHGRVNKFPFGSNQGPVAFQGADVIVRRYGGLAAGLTAWKTVP